MEKDFVDVQESGADGSGEESSVWFLRARTAEDA